MLRLSALSLAVAGAMGVAHTANAEGVDVSGSVGVANMYLWRGYDLGVSADGDNHGEAAVSGDLKVSAAGAYAGVWGSSGDATYGTEYDLYVGYGIELGGVTVDLSVWNYMYPSYAEPTTLDDFAGLSDAVLNIGFAGFTLGFIDNIAGGAGCDNRDGSDECGDSDLDTAGAGGNYYSLSYAYKSVSVLVGHHDRPGNAEDADMTHANVSYAYNDNLSFTFSQQVDQEADEDLKFVVAYSLPIGD